MGGSWGGFLEFGLYETEFYLKQNRGFQVGTDREYREELLEETEKLHFC